MAFTITNLLDPNKFLLSNVTLNNGVYTFPAGNIVGMISGGGLTTPIVNHKYYGRVVQKRPAGNSVADSRFEYYGGDLIYEKNIVFGSFNDTPADGSWHATSAISAFTSIAGSGWTLRSFAVNPSTILYRKEHIIVDLTADFGAGNEPTKEWCDRMIPYFVGTVTIGATARYPNPVKIDSTIYGIVGGTTKINGVDYSIARGKTKIDGTARTINFGPFYDYGNGSLNKTIKGYTGIYKNNVLIPTSGYAYSYGNIDTQPGYIIDTMRASSGYMVNYSQSGPTSGITANFSTPIPNAEYTVMMVVSNGAWTWSIDVNTLGLLVNGTAKTLKQCVDLGIIKPLVLFAQSWGVDGNLHHNVLNLYDGSGSAGIASYPQVWACFMTNKNHNITGWYFTLDRTCSSESKVVYSCPINDCRLTVRPY